MSGKLKRNPTTIPPTIAPHHASAAAAPQNTPKTTPGTMPSMSTPAGCWRRSRFDQTLAPSVTTTAIPPPVAQMTGGLENRPRGKDDGARQRWQHASILRSARLFGYAAPPAAFRHRRRSADSDPTAPSNASVDVPLRDAGAPHGCATALAAADNRSHGADSDLMADGLSPGTARNHRALRSASGLTVDSRRFGRGALDPLAGCARRPLSVARPCAARPPHGRSARPSFRRARSSA